MKRFFYRLLMQLTYNMGKYHLSRGMKWNDRYEQLLEAWYCGTFKGGSDNADTN